MMDTDTLHDMGYEGLVTSVIKLAMLDAVKKNEDGPKAMEWLRGEWGELWCSLIGLNHAIVCGKVGGI